MIPSPQYTLNEAIGICLALGRRALSEVRALARLPGPRGERGERGEIGKQGPAGPKGDPGRDANNVEAVAEQIGRMLKLTTPDGGRTLRWALGDTVHEIKTALVLDAGAWKEGKTYVTGDGVTFGGSFFIAQTETTAKPQTPQAGDDWRLAVKRGGEYRPEDKRTARAAEPIRFK